MALPRLPQGYEFKRHEVQRPKSLRRLPDIDYPDLIWLRNNRPLIYKFLMYFPYKRQSRGDNLYPYVSPRDDIDSWFKWYLSSIAIPKNPRGLSLKRGDQTHIRRLHTQIHYGDTHEDLNQELKEMLSSTDVDPEQVSKLSSEKADHLLHHHSIEPLFHPEDISDDLPVALVKQREMELSSGTMPALEFARKITTNRDSLLAYVSNMEPVDLEFARLNVA